MKAIGKVMLTPKGDYISTTPYEVLDLVRHRGKSWVSLRAQTGVEPIVTDSNWQLLAEDGSGGDMYKMDYDDPNGKGIVNKARGLFDDTNNKDADTVVLAKLSETVDGKLQYDGKNIEQDIDNNTIVKNDDGELEVNENLASVIDDCEEWVNLGVKGKIYFHNGKIWECLADNSIAPADGQTNYWKRINIKKITSDIGSLSDKSSDKITFENATAKVKFRMVIDSVAIPYANGKGEYSIPNATDKVISSAAFAVIRGQTGSLSITGVEVNTATKKITISLGNTTYTSPSLNPPLTNIMYFVVD